MTLPNSCLPDMACTLHLVLRRSSSSRGGSSARAKEAEKMLWVVIELLFSHAHSRPPHTLLNGAAASQTVKLDKYSERLRDVW